MALRHSVLPSVKPLPEAEPLEPIAEPLEVLLQAKLYHLRARLQSRTLRHAVQEL